MSTVVAAVAASLFFTGERERELLQEREREKKGKGQRPSKRSVTVEWSTTQESDRAFPSAWEGDSRSLSFQSTTQSGCQ